MLSDDQVQEIRVRFAAGERQTELAAEYGVGQNTISSLVTGRTRVAAGGPLTRGSSRKLDSTDVVEIRRAVAEGVPVGELTTFYGVSQQMISNIATGRAYSDIGGPLQGHSSKARSLTSEEVEAIRAGLVEGRTREGLAAAFGISPWTVDWVRREHLARRSREERDRKRADVIAIREQYRAGKSQAEIAREFGHTQQMVSRIVRGETHVSTAGPLAAKRVRRLDEATVVRIRNAFKAGSDLGELADRHETTVAVIRQVVSGASYSTLPGPTFQLDRRGRIEYESSDLSMTHSDDASES